MLQESLKNKFNCSNALELIYLIVIFLGLYIDAMLPFTHGVTVLRKLLIILLVLFSIILEKHTRQQWVILIAGIIIYTFGLLNHYNDLEELLLIGLIFGGSTLNPKKVIKHSIILIALFLLGVTIASKCGVIQNLLFYRDGMIRQSLGMMYPLTYAGFVFYACAGLVMINYDKRNIWWKVIILGVLIIFVYKVNGARNDTLGIFFLILCLFSDFLSLRLKKIISYFLIFLLSIIIIISIFITKYLPYSSNFYPVMNKLLSGRLDLQGQLWNFYHPTLFGQYIAQNGLGRSTQTIFNYFYIDNSYLRLLFINGIVFFILFLIILYSLLYRLIHNKLYKEAFIIIVLAIAGITEDSFINSLMNIFLMMFMTESNLLIQSFGKGKVVESNKKLSI